MINDHQKNCKHELIEINEPEHLGPWGIAIRVQCKICGIKGEIRDDQFVPDEIKNK